MQIYCAHARSFDYEKEYYEPLRTSSLAIVHKLIFPHATEEFFDSTPVIAESQLVLAEVTFPATGLGIELGRAQILGIPILAIHEKGVRPSSSVLHIASLVLEYEPSKDLVQVVEIGIEQLLNQKE